MVKEPEESDKLIHSETKFAMLVVKFSICDKFLKIVSDMFPDNKLAKIYEAGKTKTLRIIKVKRRGNLKNLNCRPTNRKRATKILFN